MKRLTITLLCLTSLLLSACGKISDENQPNNNNIPQTTQAMDPNCYYYDIKNNTFTDQILINLNVPQDFIESKSADLLSKDPFYYIGEYKNDSTSISIFQYNDNLDFNKYINIGEDWFIDTNENEHIKIFYKNINNTIVGITISNLDNSELTTTSAIEMFSNLINTKLNTPEDNDTNITVEGSLKVPAKLNDWVSTYLYNKDSKKYEPVLISINNVYVDNINASKITKYNNWLLSKKMSDLQISETRGTDNIIFEYSIFYPSNYTITDGKVSDLTIPMTIVNLTDTSTTINGVMNLYKSIKFLNEMNEVSVAAGEEFTEGIGTYKMTSGYTKYLIKIDSGNGEPKYFSVS